MSLFMSKKDYISYVHISKKLSSQPEGTKSKPLLSCKKEIFYT